MQSRSRRFLMLAALTCAALLAATPLAAKEAGTGSGSSKASGSSPGALADVLENDAARQRLIEDLRRMEAKRAPNKDEALPEPALTERVVAAAQATAEAVATRFHETVAAVTELTRPRAVDWDTVAAAALQLAIVIGATLALYIVLRYGARLPYSRADRWVLQGPARTQPLRRAAAVAITVAIDALVVVLASLGGWALALFALGEPGSVDARLALFLTTFVAVAAGKLALRLVFAKRYDGLRLLPIAGVDAAYWQGFLTRLVGFVGYGILLVVPLVADLVAPGMGQAVHALVVVLAFGYAVTILWRNRRKVGNRLDEMAQRTQIATTRLALGLLARVWHLIAIAYLAALAVALLVRPEQALPFMATATLQTLVAIGVGLVISALLGRAIGRGAPLPEGLRQALPALEPRLNALMPRSLQIVRILVTGVALAIVLDGWQLLDLWQWLATEAAWRMIATVVSLGVIVVIAGTVWVGLSSWIDHSLSPDAGTGKPSARGHTLLPLLRTALAVVLIVMTAMVLVAELGINIGPLMAGAGILGLALGFGAQKLVQDIIGGIFIQIDDAIHTGDWVTAGNISGTAEMVSIRSVGLRDLAGTFHFIPYSAVDTVSNYNRDFAYHVGYYGVAYREDTDQVVPHLMTAFRNLLEDPEMAPLVLGDLEIDGVNELAESAVRIRVRIMTQPGAQWTVGRAYNRLVKKRLDAAGIEIPFPHTTLYFGNDQTGDTAPANVRLIETADTGTTATASSDDHDRDAGATQGNQPPENTPAKGAPGDGGGGE